MASPAPCLLLLRRQLDERYPDRPKSSDGIMGDARHLLRKSDHNQGNAIDITAWPGGRLDVDHLAEVFRAQMRRTNSGRLSLIIRGRRMCSPRTMWEWQRYTGRNPHVTHLHLSVRADMREVMRHWSF
jgi:hypothetical protein